MLALAAARSERTEYAVVPQTTSKTMTFGLRGSQIAEPHGAIYIFTPHVVAGLRSFTSKGQPLDREACI